jgi:hypothetical protein
VYDPVTVVLHTYVIDAEPIGVLRQTRNLATCQALGRRPFASKRGDGVIGDGDVGARTTQRSIGGDEAGERLRARHLLDEVTINVEQAIAVIIGLDDVGVPDLVIEGQGSRPCTICRVGRLVVRHATSAGRREKRFECVDNWSCRAASELIMMFCMRMQYDFFARVRIRRGSPETPLTSTQSSRSSPSLKPCYEKSERGPTKPSQTTAPKSLPNTNQPNAPHT